MITHLLGNNPCSTRSWLWMSSVTCQVSVGMTLWVVGSLPSRYDLQEGHRRGGLAPPGPRPPHAAQAVPLPIHRAVLGSHWSIHPVNHGTVH